MSPMPIHHEIEPRSAVPMLSATELMEEAGCSHRQIDHWVKVGLIAEASGEPTPGSGIPRSFTRDQVFMAKIVNVLTGFGMRGDRLYRAVAEVRDHSPAARLVYVKQDGSTDWGPGVPAAIVIDLDQFRFKSSSKDADR